MPPPRHPERTVTALAIVLALAVAYAAGYWTHHRRTAAINEEHHYTREELQARKDGLLQLIRHTPPHGTRTL